MFDTMTLTKIVGGFCGALLIFLLGKWVAETVYHAGGGHGDHYEQAYVIDTGEEGGGEQEKAEGPSFAELFVSADAGKGERVFNKCKACHKLEKGANSTGPYLYGVVGRDVGAAEGFGYSGSLKAVADVWTPENLNAFLENPSGYAPGTNMGFSGLGDIEDRANLIAFLDQTDGDTYEMEVPSAAKEEAAAEEVPAAEEATDEASAAEEVTSEQPATAEAEATPEAEAETAAMSEEPAEGDATAVKAAEETAAMEEEPAEEPAADEGGFAAMVAAANPEDGKKVFRKCQACHVADKEQNRVGPHLVGLVGRPVAGVEGFRYSDAMQAVGGEWTYDKLNAWLENPKAFAPGNKMSFAGVKDEEDRASVIAYIESAAD